VVARPPIAQPLPGGGQSGTTAPTNPFAPVTGLLADPTTGRPAGSGPGRGSLGGTGGGNGGEPGGRGANGSGGAVSGATARESAAAARTAAQTSGRGVAGGMAPGAGRREEDKERPSPGYLRDYNDEFWDDTPSVAPAVIGEDDD
jgi:hypothetical protein